MKTFSFCILMLVVRVAVNSAELRAGAAAVMITPEKPIPMAGYYSKRLSEGVHDDLFAKALVLDDGTNKAALVVCDLITMPRGVVERARELIGTQTGVPGENVMISATHTHTGPVLHTGTSRARVDGGSTDVVAEYTGGLAKRIAEAVKLAESKAQAATVSAAIEREAKLSHNRRFFMKDGTVGWNPGKLNPNIRKVAGPVDPDVSVLYFKSGPTNALATYVNFAMHPDTVGGLQFSADYPYTLARLLGAYRGTNMVTLFANGTCGDINHVDVNWADPQKGHIEAARIGTILAADVLKAYTRLEPVNAGTIRVRSEMVALALPEITAGDLDRASNIVARIGDRTNAPKFLEQVFAFKVLDVAARKGKPHQVEVQVIAAGNDVAWVSLPGEIFVELGLSIKEKSPFRYTFIAELANGAIGYIPTSRAYDEGNYEPVSARCAKGSGERLVASAVELLHQVQKRH